MKKRIIILVLTLFLCGCTNVKRLNYDQIIDTFQNQNNHINVYRTGYKYALPRTMQIENYKLFNEVLSSNKATFYLYIDAVSYYNKTTNELEKDSSTKYFKTFEYDDKQGYVKINLKENDKYLIEIIYNYAKIEVMVEENLVNKVLVNSISILNSIKYNDATIERMLQDNELNYTEEVFEIFENNAVNSDILEFEKDNENDNNEDEVRDTDFIN